MEVNTFAETNKLLASQGTPRILCKPDIHYSMYKNPSPTPNLSQIELVHAPFLKTHFNIIFTPPRCSKWSLSLRIHYQHPVCTTHLAHTFQISLQFSDHSNVHCWLQETCYLTTLFLSHTDRI